MTRAGYQAEECKKKILSMIGTVKEGHDDDIQLLGIKYRVMNHTCRF
jgi:hypothetical protein